MTEQEYAADEINLRDCINIIIKRKKVVLSIFITSVVIGIIASFLMPKIYEMSVNIQLASLKDTLITKEEARQKILNSDLLIPVIQEVGIKLDVESLKKIIRIEDIKNTNLLSIKIKYRDSDIALVILKKITASFISEMQPLYENNKSLLKKRIEELDSEIQDVLSDIEITQKNLKRLLDSESHSDLDANFKTFLIQNYLPSYMNHLFDLRNEKNKLSLVLINAKNLELLDLSPKPKHPVRPNKTLNLFISITMGLIGGMIWAFFMEYWEKSKQI